ncbi:MAG: hypothetical protein WKG07_34235 [Hymenobacter sp.]
MVLDFEGNVGAGQRGGGALHRPGRRGPPAWLGQPLGALPGPWGPALGALAEGQPRALRLSGLQAYRAHAAHFLDRGFTRRVCRARS